MNLVSVEEIPLGQDVDISDTDHIIDMYGKMVQFSRTNGYPLGLSAVQVGIPEKFFIARCDMYPYGDSDIDYGYIGYINCQYFPPTPPAEVVSIEGCLSLPGKIFKLNRFPRINLRGYMMGVNVDTFEVEVLKINQLVTNSRLAQVLQHEIDHGNNILISDLGDEIE